MLTRVRFHPQAWVNDYAIEVDPEGETEFMCDVPEGIEDDSYESDHLASHPSAPKWVQNWRGPFWIEVLWP